MTTENKIPCEQCGTLILPTTAEKTGGLCMTCVRLSEGPMGLMKDGKTFNKELQEREPKSSEGCFIATATMGSSENDAVQTLRQFRDDVLQKSMIGERFVEIYYRYSPSLASHIGKSRVLRFLFRIFLINPLSWFAKHML